MKKGERSNPNVVERACEEKKWNDMQLGSKNRPDETLTKIAIKSANEKHEKQ